MFNQDASPLKYKPRKNVYEGSNNVFNPETFEAHSYQWWMYVCKVKGVIIFNDHNYSSSTNKHQSKMKSLLKELGHKIGFVVYQRESLSHGLFLDHDYENLALNEVRLKAAKRPDQVKELTAAIAHCKERIATLKKLGAKANMTLVNHRVNAKNSEASRLERQREKSRIAREKRALVVNQFKDVAESTAAVDI